MKGLRFAARGGPRLRCPAARTMSASRAIWQYRAVSHSPKASDRFAAIAARLTAALRVDVEAQPAARVHGGSINECYRWQSGSGALFVKVAPAAQLAMLEAEAAGLQELARARAIRVPRVLALDRAGNSAFLALEWIDLSGHAADASAHLGEQLALQHRTLADRFGWHRGNTIGSTPQINTPTASWVEFFREHRLRYQLDLAARNGYGGSLQEEGAKLLERLDGLLADHRPHPSLLHGDLWGGNFGVDAAGTPVIFDPAVYYGDREADLAMTRLFGGFGSSFHAAYEAAWPLPRGAHARTDLYNLYHVLNHLNLFGAGYQRQAESMIARVLSAA